MKCAEPNADKIINMLNNAGYKAYYVGGCVRDALSNIIPHDFDITTDALPLNTVDIFRSAGYDVIETGIKHGTVSVIMNHKSFEVTTFRTEKNYKDNRHPENVTFVQSLRDDLSRRDFTINAMAYNESEGVLDYFSGQEDLKEGIIRCVGEASKRFDEDALRILRALRFASRLGFKIEENTAKAIKEKKYLLKNISAERIFNEFTGILLGKNPAAIIREYYDVFGVFIPELLPLIGCKQNSKWHLFDVFEHTMLALENTENDLILRLAVFFHDFGKPMAKTVGEDGFDHFKGHQRISFEMTKNILNRLRADKKTIDSVSALVLHHDDRIPVNEISVKKMIKRVGMNNAIRSVKIEMADNAAQNPSMVRKRAEELQTLVKLVENILNDSERCLSIGDLKINGADLLKLGMKQGPKVGKILENALDAVIENQILNERDELLKYVKQYL